MSFGKGSSSAPTFFEGQKELASQAIQQIGQRVLGGAPSAAAGAQAIRGEQKVIQQSARSGFSSRDPITQRKLALVEAQRRTAEDVSRQQLLQTLLSPAGQKTGGGFNVGLGGK